MLPSNPICPVCNYGTSAVYCDLPSPEQLANGVKPLDSLPAAWWNNMWNMTDCSINQARGAIGSFITELNNVLAGAGICPNSVCTDQLYQAIDLIRQTIGNATTAGAVKSSSTPGMVSIDENGFMTANCLGNASQLTTTAHTLVGAVNELKSTYDVCTSGLTTAVNSKAPINHASSEATYGVGTATNYGHLRISNTYTSDIGDAGAAASQSALAAVYNYATQISAAAIGLGNTAGCALGTASAGSATTSARSDHVHPIPSCVQDKYDGTQYIGIGYSNNGLTPAQVAYFAGFSTSYETGCVVIKDITVDNVKQVLGLGSAAYANVADFRPSTWVPDTVNNACNACSAEFSIRACGLPELAGLGCDPHVYWAMHNIWNYCQDCRNYLLSYPSNDPSGNALQATRVDYANCATTLCVDTKIADANYSIAMTADEANTHGYYGVSTCCPFTFNPITGVVTAQCFNGVAASLSYDNSVYVHAECGNEFNIYSTTSSYAWINYRGGASTIYIGNGSGFGAYGTVRAACFEGPASSADCACNARCACLACYIRGYKNGQPDDAVSISFCRRS